MRDPEHLGIKINKTITSVLVVIALALVLVSGFYFLKAALA